MPRTDVTQMPFAKLYPLLVSKAEKKGRTRQEVDQVTAWLTGYTSPTAPFSSPPPPPTPTGTRSPARCAASGWRRSRTP